MKKQISLLLLLTLTNSIYYTDVEDAYTDIFEPYYDTIESNCGGGVNAALAILNTGTDSNGYTPSDATLLTKDSFKQLLKDLREFQVDRRDIFENYY